MLAAIESIKNGDSVRKAAGDWNVLKSTLRDQSNGCTKHGTRSGPAVKQQRQEETCILLD